MNNRHYHEKGNIIITILLLPLGHISNRKFPLVYESDTLRDSLYEEHGATLKHKCGKRIVTLPLLSFSLIFLFFLFFLFFWWASLASFFIWAFLASFIFISPESHPDLWGNHSLHHPFLTETMF